MVTSIAQIPYMTLTPAAITEVAARAAARGQLNDRTLMKGDGNAAGFTGEELVRAYLPFLMQDRENRDFDFYTDIIPTGPQGSARVLTPMRFTFDVKSRRIKVAPRLDFDCKIPVYQVKRQKCDAYIFTAPREDMRGGWLLGWISKADFMARAAYHKKGYRHASGIQLREDHYFITVKDLQPMEELRKPGLGASA